MDQNMQDKLGIIRNFIKERNFSPSQFAVRAGLGSHNTVSRILSGKPVSKETLKLCLLALDKTFYLDQLRLNNRSWCEDDINQIRSDYSFSKKINIPFDDSVLSGKKANKILTELSRHKKMSTNTIVSTVNHFREIMDGGPVHVYSRAKHSNSWIIEHWSPVKTFDNGRDYSGWSCFDATPDECLRDDFINDLENACRVAEPRLAFLHRRRIMRDSGGHVTSRTYGRIMSGIERIDGSTEIWIITIYKEPSAMFHLFPDLKIG